MAEPEVEDKELKEAMNAEMKNLFMKYVTDILDNARKQTNIPQEEPEEINIYEKLTPGEIMIVSRSKKGFLVAANCEGECDIRYYSDGDSEE